MKKWLFYVILFLALLGRYAGALPQGREMEELSLITTLAADRKGSGVAVTAVTGVRAGEDEEPKILTGNGSTLSDACQAAQKTQASHAYLGQTGELLLGEELARDGLMDALSFVLDERELRLDTLLYIVKGSAGSGLAATAPETAQETPGEDKRGRTTSQVLSRLCAGQDALVPALAPDVEGLLTPIGWAVLGPEGLRGFQEEEGETV